FVVASEAISVGNTTVTLPGVGSYIALAIEQKNLGAIGWAIGAMFVVILIFDQLLFRPLIASADWFRLEQEVGLTPSRSWALTMMRRSRVLGLIARAFAALLRAGRKPGAAPQALPERRRSVWDAHWIDYAWYVLRGLLGLVAVVKTTGFVLGEGRPAEIGQVSCFRFITLVLAVVAPGGAAVGVSLLRDRGDHRLGRLVERQRCRGSRKLGSAEADRARNRCLHRGSDQPRGLSAHGAGDPGAEPVRRDVESPVLAAAVRARRAQVPPELRDRLEETLVNATAAALNLAPLLDVRAVSKSFRKPDGDALVVLEDVNLTLRPGEIVGFLGRSGCGKSTLLRLIAGLDDPSRGVINYLGRPVGGAAAGMAMVFQSFALFPWLTVVEDVQLGLEALGLPQPEMCRRA